MQLYKLDSNFVLEDLIEDYSSLIWTERYRPCGDFVLKTSRIEQTMTALPLGSCVSLLDSKELMWVENHSITTNEDGDTWLEVSGRSFETFFENRTTLTTSSTVRPDSPITNATTGENNALRITASTAPAAAVTAFDSFQNGLAYIDSRDVLSDWVIVNSVPSTGLPTAQRFVERGVTYDVALKILEEHDDGIRNERPPSAGSNIVSYVYNGTDRTLTVILDVNAGHFETTSYLWSNKDYRNVVYVASQKDSVIVGATTTTEFTRRVGSLELPEITDAASSTVAAMLTSKGNTYLSQHKKVVLFEGRVSSNIPFTYGVDYFLGDTVKCRGNYSVTQNMTVTEYIRVEDENGEIGYPTLTG